MEWGSNIWSLDYLDTKAVAHVAKPYEKARSQQETNAQDKKPDVIDERISGFINSNKGEVRYVDIGFKSSFEEGTNTVSYEISNNNNDPKSFSALILTSPSGARDVNEENTGLIWTSRPQNVPRGEAELWGGMTYRHEVEDVTNVRLDRQSEATIFVDGDEVARFVILSYTPE